MPIYEGISGLLFWCDCRHPVGAHRQDTWYAHNNKLPNKKILSKRDRNSRLGLLLFSTGFSTYCFRFFFVFIHLMMVWMTTSLIWFESHVSQVFKTTKILFFFFSNKNKCEVFNYHMRNIFIARFLGKFRQSFF